jgi:Ser/Thr protein kinase RdoA (MazF antagonist)
MAVIDFDDCGFSWYMYDAATLMSFYEQLPGAPGRIEHWLEGYRTVRVVAQADEEEIPTFVMLRRLPCRRRTCSGHLQLARLCQA